LHEPEIKEKDGGIGTSARTIEKYIYSLKKGGYIERRGPK
jgi:hypothetical protein